MTIKILHLGVNLLGRDFVCGDIHGSKDLVEKFLAAVNFDKTKDRLICCGDLVDRGPNSFGCLEYLDEPWFFMVMGNHEQMMIDYFTGGPYGYVWSYNGGAWALNEVNKDPAGAVAARIKEAALQMKELPLLITVDKKDGGKFHVLHAELRSKTELTDEILADPEALTEAATVQTQDGDAIIWGRFIFYRAHGVTMDETQMRKFKTAHNLENNGRHFGPNLSHIYSGHTIIKRPIKFMGQTNLDTMAYGSYKGEGAWCGLTVTEPETGTFWLVNGLFTEVKPVIIE